MSKEEEEEEGGRGTSWGGVLMGGGVLCLVSSCCESCKTLNTSPCGHGPDHADDTRGGPHYVLAEGGCAIKLQAKRILTFELRAPSQTGSLTFSAGTCCGGGGFRGYQ